MARINKTQTYAIRWLNSQGLNNEKIAEELGLNIEQVQKTIEKFTIASEEQQVATATSPVSNPMITKTSGKGANNVAIMTKEASQQHDSNREKFSSSQTSKAIFRPKNNG
jgi:orotate phosphoribosyltransferase-like protein